MMSLLLTLAAFTAFILAAELLCWRLFYRKMTLMQLPSVYNGQMPSLLSLYRLRVFAIGHTVGLISFIWMFCIFLW